MTDFEANRLILMLAYNFAGFMPNDIEGVAVKKGMWMDELTKYDEKIAEDAITMLIQTMQYPPKIADFREVVGVSVRRNEQLVGIEGPTFGTQEGNSAMYTADMDRVNKLMADLDKELAGMTA